MTYSYSKLSFDHFDYMDPSAVGERKTRREEKKTPNCISAKVFASCSEKESRRKKVGKFLNHISSTGKMETTFQGISNLWLEERFVIENNCNYNT